MNFLYALFDSWQSEVYELLEWPGGTFSEFAEFLDFYPFLLSLMWSFYALQGIIRDLSGRRGREMQSDTAMPPAYTVMIPFYSEIGAAIRSAESLRGVTPPPAEIILVDDGSPPETQLAAPFLPPRARIVRFPVNRGKAGALNAAFAQVKTEIVVCLDADTTAVTADWAPMLAMFQNPRLGALTGKIQPKTSGRLVQELQALDYLAVICLIKKAESEWHALMTLSGAWAVFRRSAVQSCGGWREDVSAEDIDISWRLQAKGWGIDYNSDWVSNVEMAPTWKSLWRQRKRWSSGLGRVMRDNFRKAFTHEATNTAIAFITVFTYTWICLFVLLGLWRLGHILHASLTGAETRYFFFAGNWHLYWMTSFAVFMIQFAIAAAIDRGPLTRHLKLAMVAPLYPFYFFLIILTSCLAGFPLGLARHDSGRWKRTERSSETKGAVNS